jgi:hypothetical protein
MKVKSMRESENVEFKRECAVPFAIIAEAMVISMKAAYVKNTVNLKTARGRLSERGVML